MRFPAIDGLRAWLAWAVVFSHIVQFAGLSDVNWFAAFIAGLGGPAVMAFIVISGFVICGRIIEVKENWWQFIIRRFFRIFPLYWVLLPISAWLVATGAPSVFSPNGDYPGVLWLSHVALLQGVVPDSVWPFTSVKLLGPAWSLSLEWQFYLIAPAFIWFFVNRKTRGAAIALVLGASALFRIAYGGDYYQPSVFLSASYVFMIGILARLAVGHVKYLRLPKFLEPFLTSRAALYFGERSYSTYLVHFPAIYLVLKYVEVSTWQGVVAFAISTVILTVGVSHFLYRYIEQPFIRLGSRIAKRQAAVTA